MPAGSWSVPPGRETSRLPRVRSAHEGPRPRERLEHFRFWRFSDLRRCPTRVRKVGQSGRCHRDFVSTRLKHTYGAFSGQKPRLRCRDTLPDYASLKITSGFGEERPGSTEGMIGAAAP